MSSQANPTKFVGRLYHSPFKRPYGVVGGEELGGMMSSGGGGFMECGPYILYISILLFLMLLCTVV